jgi:hypothetical protein
MDQEPQFGNHCSLQSKNQNNARWKFCFDITWLLIWTCHIFQQPCCGLQFSIWNTNRRDYRQLLLQESEACSLSKGYWVQNGRSMTLYRSLWQFHSHNLFF